MCIYACDSQSWPNPMLRGELTPVAQYGYSLLQAEARGFRFGLQRLDRDDGNH